MMNTKRIKALFFAILFAAVPAAVKSQQGSPIEKGAMQGNFGLGMTNRGLPVYGGLDYGVHKNVTIGAQAEFRSYRQRWGGYRYNHTILGFSGNVNFHFNHLLELPEEINIYGGANVGFYIWNSPGGYGGSETGGLGVGLQLGGRYFFDENWGVNLEFGGTQHFGGGRIGATYRF